MLKIIKIVLLFEITAGKKGVDKIVYAIKKLGYISSSVQFSDNFKE